MPALLLAALTVTYLWLSQQGHAVSIPLSAGMRRMLLAVPVLYAVADYAENWALVEAVQAYPNIPYRLARRGEHPDRHQIAADRGVGGHCACSADRRLGAHVRARCRRARTPHPHPGRRGAAETIRDL